MGRKYSDPTIKTLFAEASACAYPGCQEPLILRDRGVATVVVQIAHIRSERRNGPRYDPTYPRELINSPSNLLLLCGRHHPAVDQHDSLYTVSELEDWKRDQQTKAGAGTPITEPQVREFATLTPDKVSKDEPFRRALAALAFILTTLSCIQVRSHRFGWIQIGWAVVGVVSALFAIAHGPVRTMRRPVPNIAAAIRQASQMFSLDELGKSNVLSEDIDRVIPIECCDSNAALQFTMSSFVSEVTGAGDRERWVITGPPGAGKSVLLHEIALAINDRSKDVIAVPLPLATYDWTERNFGNWLAKQVAALAGVTVRDAHRVIVQKRLFFLLDGIDTIPDRETLTKQSLPRTELPVLDRPLSFLRRYVADPRKIFLSRLGELPGFLVTARNDRLSADEAATLLQYRNATIGEIPAGDAIRILQSRLWNLPAGALTPAFRQTIQSPLYLRLAAVTCAGWDPEPPAGGSIGAVKNYLWDRYLEQKAADDSSNLLGWDSSVFRLWMRHYATAAAAHNLEWISFQRWPLLFRGRVRALFRVAKAVASAAVVGLLAILFVARSIAAIVAGVTIVVFFLAGEGAATRPMAPVRFDAERFLIVAGRQWLYALGFSLSGAAIGLCLALTPKSALHPVAPMSVGSLVLLGCGAGLLLGGVVPTLYELQYVNDAALFKQRKRKGMLALTVASCVVIGTAAGVIVGLATAVVYARSSAFLAIPLCVLLAILDALGLPLAAVLLWTAQRKGPLRIEAFLGTAEELGLARSFGPFYSLNHSEMNWFLSPVDSGL